MRPPEAGREQDLDGMVPGSNHDGVIGLWISPEPGPGSPRARRATIRRLSFAAASC